MNKAIQIGVARDTLDVLLNSVRNARILYITDTYRQASNTILAYYSKNPRYKINRAYGKITDLYNGNEIFIGIMHNEDDKYKFQGLELSQIYVPSNASIETMGYLYTRLRHGDLPTCMLQYSDFSAPINLQAYVGCIVEQETKIIQDKLDKIKEVLND